MEKFSKINTCRSPSDPKSRAKPSGKPQIFGSPEGRRAEVLTGLKDRPQSRRRGADAMPSTDATPLSEYGISRDQSSDWQRPGRADCAVGRGDHTNSRRRARGEADRA
jgi:hypothetical protein